MKNPVKDPVYFEDSYARIRRGGWYLKGTQNQQLIGQFAKWNRDDAPRKYGYRTTTFRIVKNK